MRKESPASGNSPGRRRQLSGPKNPADRTQRHVAGRRVELLSAVSGVPIAVDPDALRQAGASLRDPAPVRLAATTLGTALDAILAEKQLLVCVPTAMIATKQARMTIVSMTAYSTAVGPSSRSETTALPKRAFSWMYPRHCAIRWMTRNAMSGRYEAGVDRSESWCGIKHSIRP